jgi:cytochrome b subunit of formate dehydrogenase
VDAVDRKATIVIEHLIQSLMCRMMQHWHIYAQMESLVSLRELYRAFVEGRSDKDPSEFWYRGEMGILLTLSIIPLAKKLKNCGL